MKILDPGHNYGLNTYDGEVGQVLTFMKREGAGYPGNVSHHPGTNCQEVLRALIDRVKYLQNQIPCHENVLIISHLRNALAEFETRAARRHNRAINLSLETIEEERACLKCGHLQCLCEEG